MELKELLEKITLEDSNERKCIGNNPFTALQKPPQEFQEVAKAILSGYFVVQNSSNESELKTCVEIYYHEEQDNGVKDPIVYYRNRKRTDNIEIKPPSWEDDEECDLKESSPRKNVFEYQSAEFDYE